MGQWDSVFLGNPSNGLVGYAIAVMTQIVVFPLFALTTMLAENLALARSSL